MPDKPKSGSKKKSVKEEALISKIQTMVEDAENAASVWATKQEKNHRMRMRIKPGKKTFPFKGCADIRMPTIEKQIRKAKAGILNVLFGIRPIVQVMPGPTGSIDVALKIEKFLDHLCMERMDGFSKKLTIAVDQTLEKGFYLAKPYWKLEITLRQVELSVSTLGEDKYLYLLQGGDVTPELVIDCANGLGVDISERVRDENLIKIESGLTEIASGKEKVNIFVKDVICDYPDVALIPPERFYVPPETSLFLQDASFAVHEFYLPLRAIQQNADEQVGKGWKSEAVKKLEEYQATEIDDNAIDIAKDQREGIDRLKKPNSYVRLWEFQGWDDINDDGVEEKVLYTIAPDFKLLLRKILHPLDSGKYNFVRFSAEVIDNRWYSSRGIPELIEDIAKEIDMQHMNKLDNQLIRNAPMFLYRAGFVNPNLIQFIPGQGLPVKGSAPLNDTLSVLNSTNTNAEFSYEREEQMLNTQLQELIAQPDFSLQSMINRREPRTAGEVQLQTAALGGQFALDIRHHTESFSELLTQIFELWNQYGPDEYEFNYFGDTGNEPIKLTKEEIQGRYRISVRGNDQNTNPQVKLQKAQAILTGVTNPILIQTGVITPEQIAEGYKRYLQALDIPNIERLTAAQIIPVDQVAQNAKFTGADLTDAEKAQVLERMGIKPDLMGRALLAKQNEGQNAQQS